MHVATSKPSEEIAKAAAERDTDLIVVGKHGQGWVETAVIGSTTALCEITQRPELMVPLQAKEVCPVVPGRVKRLHWPLSDPAAAGDIAAFRAARDQIKGRNEVLAQLDGSKNLVISAGF